MFKKGDKVRCKFAYASDSKNIIAGKSYTVCDSSYGRWHQFTNVIGENGNETYCLSSQFELVTEKEDDLQNLEVKVDTSAMQEVKDLLDNAKSRIEELEQELSDARNGATLYQKMYTECRDEIDTASDFLTLIGISKSFTNENGKYTTEIPLITRIALYAVSHNKNAN